MENRILLVDENEIYRDIMMRILCKEYSVEQVDNVGQAMDYLAKDINGIVAVLVDMLGSTTDGFTLLDAISKVRYMAKFRLLFYAILLQQRWKKNCICQEFLSAFDNPSMRL